MFTVNLSDDQKKTATGVIGKVILLIIVCAVAFGVGWYKGRTSCKTVDVVAAKKSLAAGQNASHNTSKYHAEMIVKNAALQAQLNNIKEANANECLKSEIPIDVLDLLNQ